MATHNRKKTRELATRLYGRDIAQKIVSAGGRLVNGGTPVFKEWNEETKKVTTRLFGKEVSQLVQEEFQERGLMNRAIRIFQKDDVEALKKLHQKCSNLPHLVDETEYANIIVEAVLYEAINCLKYLHQEGASLDRRFAGSPVKMAVYSGNVEITRYLLENGVSVKNKNLFRDLIEGEGSAYRKPYPEEKRVELAELLLSHGANPFEKSVYNDFFEFRFGLTARQAAKKYGFEKLEKCLEQGEEKYKKEHSIMHKLFIFASLLPQNVGNLICSSKQQRISQSTSKTREE